MKRVVLLLVMVSAWVTGSAQKKMTLEQRMDLWKNDMEEFNSRRKERLQEEALVDTVAWLQARKALADTSFVVEAGTVTFRYGHREVVNSSTNFVSVDGDRAVVQVSPLFGGGGPNGLGGITLDGRVSDIRTKQDRKGRIHCMMNVVGRGINATLRITMVPGSPDALVEVSPNFSSNTVTLEGKMVPYIRSRVMEGLSL